MKIRRIAGLMLALLLMLPGLAAAEETDNYAVTCLDMGSRWHSYDSILNELAKYPHLRKVDMYATPILQSQAEELEKIYPYIEFGWTLRFGDDHLVRTDVTAFSTLHYSNSRVHGTNELSVLRYCKNLKALDIGHNTVDDISWISELTDLRVLIIAVNRLTDITPLAGLKKLEYLELFNNYITDLSPISGLTHLMDLNISYNKIRDFSPLYEMKWLDRVWLYKSGDRNGDGIGIPQKTVDQLKKKLPRCQFDFTSRPTLGGWREHPHYEVIRKMFAGTEYIPFKDSYEDDGVDQEPAAAAGR